MPGVLNETAPEAPTPEGPGAERWPKLMMVLAACIAVGGTYVGGTALAAGGWMLGSIIIIATFGTIAQWWTLRRHSPEAADRMMVVVWVWISLLMATRLH